MSDCSRRRCRKRRKPQRGLPLGLADKLFIALADAEEFEPNSRVFGPPTASLPPAISFARSAGRDRGLFRRQPCRRVGSRGRARFFRLRGVGIDRPLRQRFRAPDETNSYASLGRRSVCARLLFVCAAGHGGLPCRVGRAGGRPPVFRRRSMLARRLLDRTWRLDHRGFGRRAGACRALTFMRPTEYRKAPRERSRTGPLSADVQLAVKIRANRCGVQSAPWRQTKHLSGRRRTRPRP